MITSRDLVWEYRNDSESSTATGDISGFVRLLFLILTKTKILKENYNN